MATRFEIALHGGDPVRLRAAAEEALDEVQRVERRLSYFDEGSEIRKLNLHAGAGPVKVSPELFQVLRLCRRLHNLSSGGFDPTIGPLMRALGFRGSPPENPSRLDEIRSLVGMHQIEMDESSSTIRFAQPGIKLDLGAIGKGYAVARGVLILREAGIENALIHGGTSSIQALGCQPDGSAWKVAIETPPGAAPAATTEPAGQPMAVIPLLDRSLSVSAIWGRKAKPSESEPAYGHIINPFTGTPQPNGVMAAVVAEDGADADALSTALLVLGEPGLDQLNASMPGLGLLLASQSEKDGPMTLHHRSFPGLLNPTHHPQA